MFSVTLREPGLSLNDDGLARTYGVRFAPLLTSTPAVARFCTHGRTVTVTFKVSLVVFLTVNFPTLPRLAVLSTRAGEMDTPPVWAAWARGAESSARAITPPVAPPATARPRAPATSRLRTSITSGISLFGSQVFRGWTCRLWRVRHG